MTLHGAPYVLASQRDNTRLPVPLALPSLEF